MERKRRIQRQFLNKKLLLRLVLLPCLALSCTKEGADRIPVRILLTDGYFRTKAYDPDEDRLEDIHLYIFGTEGELEYQAHTHSSHLQEMPEGYACDVELINGRTYDFYACANLGYSPVIRDRNELEDLSCHLAYPDEYRKGLPMSCQMKGVQVDRGRTLKIVFQRMMAKICLSMDRSHLDPDVNLTVRSVKIGNCPREMKFFRKNTVKNTDQLFSNGFVREEYECQILNGNEKNGVSGKISLYLFENRQGRIETADGTAAGKLFPENDERSQFASYIEIAMDYMSGKYFTPEKELIYRFWLGEDQYDVNVERNCRYHIKVTPVGDGLGTEGWRIDKTGMREVYEQTEFRIMPSRYLEGRVGEDVHVWCEYAPDWAPFDIGLEELEYDKSRGIYDYTVDPDGRGVVLHLKKRGQGILFMSAGTPVNRSDMAYIEIFDKK